MDWHQSCGMYIKQIHDALERTSNNQMREQGITFVQMTALLVLQEAEEGQLSFKALEKALHVAQSTTAGVIRRLEQKGLVSSFGDTQDRRVKLVRITPLGVQYCRGAEASMAQAEEALLDGLTETEREIFRSVLRKVSQTIE